MSDQFLYENDGFGFLRDVILSLMKGGEGISLILDVIPNEVKESRAYNHERDRFAALAMTQRDTMTVTKFGIV